MALVVSNAGALRCLDILRTQFNALTLFFNLFQNNYTPVKASVLADYTPATFDGYGAIGVNSYVVPILVAGRALVEATPLVFQMTGNTTPNLIYGYYVTDGIAADPIFAERLPGAPIAMNISGDFVAFTPSFTGVSEFS